LLTTNVIWLWPRFNYGSTKAGHLYQEGMIFSPDGHCRAFDAKAQERLSAAGWELLLKRLEDAIADADYIHAVIKGSAINNDGLKSWL